MKKTLYICIPLMGAVLAGCESDATLQDGDYSATSLTIKAPVLASDGTEGREMPGQTIYQFENGKFLTTIAVGSDENEV